MGFNTRSFAMTALIDSLHIIIPLGAAAFFMAITAFVSIEQAFGKN